MTIFYPDTSNWQEGISLVGAPAAVCKATQGDWYRDPDYADSRAQAAALGIPFAAYHWLDTTDAAAQARFCYSVVGPDIPLMIDDEQNIIAVEHTLAFVHAYRAAGGLVTLEYAPRWVWEASGEPDLRPLADAGLAIVSSHYTSYSDTGPGWEPYGGITPAIWQYTARQPFNGQLVDFNAFRGSLAELVALFHGHSQKGTTDVKGIIVEANDSRVLAWVDRQLGRVYQDIGGGEGVVWGAWHQAGFEVDPATSQPYIFPSLAVLGREIGEARAAWAKEQAAAIAATIPGGAGQPVAHVHEVPATGPAVAGGPA